MPLMRSWVTRPEENAGGEFESLNDLSFTDAEEVYVDFHEVIAADAPSVLCGVPWRPSQTQSLSGRLFRLIEELLPAPR